MIRCIYRQAPLFWVIALFAIHVGLDSRAAAEDLNRAAETLLADYRAELEELADWCDERGLVEQAQQTRSWQRPRSDVKLYLPILPKTVGTADLPAVASGDLVEWHRQISQRKRRQSTALFDLARRAVRAKRSSFAIDLILAAIRENPDNEAVRNLLGHRKYRGEWRSDFEIRNLRRGLVDHERFGWIPKTHVRRYEQNQRFVDGQWISADRDALQHQNILAGWDIETEHYTIRTNKSIESGVELSRKLERLYRVWKQLFVRYFLTEHQVITLFDGRSRSRPTTARQHGIVFFRDRDDYNSSLRQAFPNIGISIGVYVDNTSRAYFFAGKDYDERTLLHEATHQLFHETSPVVPNVGAEANFWIVEGIALFMESLHEEDGYHVLGGFDDARLEAAQYRLIEDGFYIPFDELTAMGMKDIQKHPKIATLYSQAAGMTHFLVFYDSGRYRDALVAYLSAVYRGQHNANTLAHLTGTTYAELDRQYRQFMQPAEAQ